MRLAVIAMIAPCAALAEPAFRDASSTLPIQHVYSGGWEHFVGGGVAVFDCDGDGYPDLFAAGGEAPAALFRNETASTNGKLAFSRGDIPEITGVTGAYPLDVDSDGHSDLVILRVGSNRLWKGEPDCQFTDHTDALGLPEDDRWTTAFSAVWEGGAPMPTLVFGNYVDRDDPEGPFGTCDDNQVFRPFDGAYRRAEILTPGYCALSMLVSDWRRTGEAELRISNDRHYYVRGGYEEMWRLNPLSSRDESDGWEKISLWGMGIASADLTDDGRPEVMLTSMGDQVLQFNDGNSFRNAPFSIGTYSATPHVGDDGRPSTGWHAEFGDIDNDGLLDLFIAKGNVDQMPSNAMRDPNNLLIQNADGSFTEIASEVGVATTERSRGAALTDLNLDGRLDIVVVNRRAPMEIWQNQSSGAGDWLQVALDQEAPNRDAIGAWIEVRIGDRTLSREITVGGGHAGGALGPAHFGLGEADNVLIRVIWPDGELGPWAEVAPNQRITVTRALD
ncbi:MAG: CRTAC1 family protein [Paracoccaceae bacterium]|nr:CRTAC1 family protein [Paracoccaceae bacterium]